MLTAKLELDISVTSTYKTSKRHECPRKAEICIIVVQIELEWNFD